MQQRPEQGYTLVEMLVSLAVLLLFFSGLAPMLLQNSRINRAAQMTSEAQTTARNSLAMVVQALRSAGWDPLNAGIAAVALDADPGDAVSEIEVFSDRDEDGMTTSPGEQVLIRHSGASIVWRQSADPDEPFTTLASNITNDADGNGVPEAMFVADSVSNPTRITVRITARSPVRSPVTREFVRYTIESQVALRNDR